jgi:hypothetical protein
MWAQNEVMAAVIENGAEALVENAASQGRTEVEAIRFAKAAVRSIDMGLNGLVAVGAFRLIKNGAAVAGKVRSLNANFTERAKAAFQRTQASQAKFDAISARGISDAIESNPLVKAEMTRYRGGIYKELEAKRGVIDRHHIPADSTTTIPTEKGLAIQIDITDHRQTSSWCSSTEAKAYRAMLQQKVDAGDMRGAVATDIWDVKAGTGRKYNKAMLEMLEVGETTGTIPLKQSKK